MEIYFCWITVLLPDIQDDIISGMARKGYMVGPTSKDGKVISSLGENSAGSVVAITVYKRTGNSSAKNIYDDLVKILDEAKGYYYSVIVAASTEATWVGSNFQLPAKKESTVPSTLPSTNTNKKLN